MRRNLAGICFDSVNAALVGTDGHRLHWISDCDVSFVGSGERPILSKNAVKALQSILKNTDDVFVSFEKIASKMLHGNAGFMVFHADAVSGPFTFLSRVIDAEFPDWPQVVPVQDRHSLDIKFAELEESLMRMKKLGSLASARNKGGGFVEATFNGNLAVSNGNGGLENVDTDRDVYPALKLELDINFLLDVLKVAKTDKPESLNFRLQGSPKNPMRIDVGNLNAVIQPMGLDDRPR